MNNVSAVRTDAEKLLLPIATLAYLQPRTSELAAHFHSGLRPECHGSSGDPIVEGGTHFRASLKWLASLKEPKFQKSNRPLNLCINSHTDTGKLIHLSTTNTL